MTGGWWRLLAAFLLILVTVLLRGQDAGDGSRMFAPLQTPKQWAIPYNEFPDRVWQPTPPGLREHNRVAPGAFTFERMVRSAGIIFSGRVTSVGAAARFSGKSTGSTTVTFQVEQAMRGAYPGSTLTIHEWGGLWSNGERYRVGEHVLLFLYPPSKFGLTSPVAGSMGRYAVDSRGNILLTPRHVAALTADPTLGRKTVASYTDFARAVQRCRRQE